MNFIFFIWSMVLIGCLSAVGISIRILAEHKIPLSESLILRGVVCLAIVFGWAYHQKLSLIPKSIKTQVFRALIAGLALTLFSLSYSWLTASTVAVLSNIDVPMLVILGSWVGQRSSLRAKALSVISILILIVYALRSQSQSDWILGLGCLGVGTFLLCFGYFFIKKSMQEENEAITVLTPSLALIAYGAIQKLGDSVAPGAWSLHMVNISLIAGVGMFGAYYATMKLYTVADLATAEFPTLVSAIAIQPLEAWVFQEALSVSQLWLTVIFVFFTYLILIADKNKSTVTHGC